MYGRILSEIEMFTLFFAIALSAVDFGRCHLLSEALAPIGRGSRETHDSSAC